MGNRKSRERNVKKRNLTWRIRIITILTAFLGIIGMAFVSGNLKLVSEEYADTIQKSSEDLEFTHEIAQKLYAHEALVFKYMVTQDEDARASVYAEADQLKRDIRGVLDEFGFDMKGRKYESYYHSIFSDVGSYFKNIDVIFEFCDQDDVATAQYYMETSLIRVIDHVNDSIRSLKGVLDQDKEAAQASMNRLIALSSLSSMVIVILILVLTGLCFIYCFRISDEMVSVDSLTRLSNYDKFIKHGTVTGKKGKLTDYTIVYLNIVNFKYINRRFGSWNGDRYLREFARKLSFFLTSDRELAARQGGDSFLAMVQSERTQEFLNYISSGFINLESETGAYQIPLKVHCGIYTVRSGDTIENAVDAAAIALKVARESEHHQRCVWYSDEIANRMMEETELLNDVERGLKNHEFVVYYQPKVNLETNTLCGCEALVRWIRDGKLIPPMKFIPALERNGKIAELDYYVFEQVCRDVKSWLERGLKPVRVSSNFSKLHLQDPQFKDKVYEIASIHGIDRNYLEIELTESSEFEDFHMMKEFVSYMKEIGIHTSLDDFGTGYSSLSVLTDMDFDVIKLDRSFLSGSDENRTKRKVLEHVVHMVRDLGRSVICEGLETAQQADFLRGIQCMMAQGYLYDRPLAVEEFEQRLLQPEYHL